MSANVGMRVRIIALVGLLAALLLGAATLMMSRSGTDPIVVDSSAPVTPIHKPKPADAQTPATKPSKEAAEAPATPKPTVDPTAVATPKPAPSTGLPTSVARALAIHDVVVVSLVSPHSPLDRVAADEARAGAARAGVGFVRIEVANREDMKRLTSELRVRHTPSLLVFTRPDRLFIQVKGFADRETVAQAATNAS